MIAMETETVPQASRFHGNSYQMKYWAKLTNRLESSPHAGSVPEPGWYWLAGSVRELTSPTGNVRRELTSCMVSRWVTVTVRTTASFNPLLRNDFPPKQRRTSSTDYVRSSLQTISF